MSDPFSDALGGLLKIVSKLSNKLPESLAYGLAVIIILVVLILLRPVVSENVLWVLFIVFISALVAFVYGDARLRLKPPQTTTFLAKLEFPDNTQKININPTEDNGTYEILDKNNNKIAPVNKDNKKVIIIPFGQGFAWKPPADIVPKIEPDCTIVLNLKEKDGREWIASEQAQRREIHETITLNPKLKVK